MHREEVKMLHEMNLVKPISIKERSSVLFLERGRLDVSDGSMVLVDSKDVRTPVPVGGITCLMLGPGTRVSHAAVSLAARAGTLLMWVGECGVRLYAAGQPGGASASHLLYQAKLALNDTLRLKVVRCMYRMRFGEEPPVYRNVDQLRGMEGKRVRDEYQKLADQCGIEWPGRSYDATDWSSGSLINRCLSSATACLYGITESAILAAGFAPSIGFLHHGQPRAFVFDIADIFKFETVVPIAFRVASEATSQPERQVRLACRDMFRSKRLLANIIPTIRQVLESAGEPWPSAPSEAQPVPFELQPEVTGDVGHRC
jgi:CRISPR-associated protein Cas1